MFWSENKQGWKHYAKKNFQLHSIIHGSFRSLSLSHASLDIFVSETFLLGDLLSFRRCSICSISNSCNLRGYVILISKLLSELMSLVIYTVFEMGITLHMKYCVGLWVLYLLQFFFPDLNCCYSIYPGLMGKMKQAFSFVIINQYKHFLVIVLDFNGNLGYIFQSILSMALFRRNNLDLKVLGLKYANAICQFEYKNLF